MATTVRLTLLTGPHKGKRFCYRAPDPVTLGRADDCEIQLSGADRDLKISRHHCRMKLVGDVLRVQDLASTNGTYLNGQPLNECTSGGPCTNLLEEDTPCGSFRNGDILTVGGTTAEVHLFDCPVGPAPADGEPSWPTELRVLKDCPRAC